MNVKLSKIIKYFSDPSKYEHFRLMKKNYDEEMIQKLIDVLLTFRTVFLSF